MKNLFENILMLAVIFGGGYALYHYLVDPPEESRSQVRYLENDQATMFHEREEAGNNLDDCYRYANPDSVQGCIERRSKDK